MSTSVNNSPVPLQRTILASGCFVTEDKSALFPVRKAHGCFSDCPDMKLENVDFPVPDSPITITMGSGKSSASLHTKKEKKTSFLERNQSYLQRSAKVFVCGCEKFVIALAYLFCLALGLWLGSA